MKDIITLGELRVRIADVFSMSRICGMTSAQEQDRLKQFVWDELNRQWANGRRVYSQYVCGYAQGVIEQQRADNYRWHLEFCYIAPDGTKYSTHKTSKHPSTDTFYARGEGSKLNDMPSGHYWIESGKPYFVGEPT